MMKLNTASSTWQIVEKLVLDDIEMSRTNLEKSGLPVEKTEYYRGRIAAMKEVLDLSAIKENPVEDLGDPYNSI